MGFNWVFKGLMKYIFFLRYSLRSPLSAAVLGLLNESVCFICQSRYVELFVVRTYTGDALVRRCLMFYAVCMGVSAELFQGARATFSVSVRIG